MVHEMPAEPTLKSPKEEKGGPGRLAEEDQMLTTQFRSLLNYEFTSTEVQSVG